MDRYDEVTHRIQKSMRRDRLAVPAATIALALGLAGLLLTWASLGNTVKWSKVACLFNPHTVACRKS
jgi:hypothetical protein